MKKKILIWGAKSKARIIEKLIKNFKKELLLNYVDFKNSRSSNIELKYIFDPYVKRYKFFTKAKFSNNKSDLKKFVNNSNSFVVCIGGEFGMARYFISKKLEKLNLQPLNIVSRFSYIDKTSKIGKGVQVMPNVVVNCFSKIGDYCILNTSSTIDHECKIGNGVHIMGSANLSGRVHVGNYVTIGTNSTILPDIKIADGAYVGAGSVVTKNVKKNQIVVGNPAKFYKYNKHKINLSIFNKL